MSASLVGSEMCIRDRGRAVQRSDASASRLRPAARRRPKSAATRQPRRARRAPRPQELKRSGGPWRQWPLARR
eukprot:14697791-Alexandrium_andersonii.AAC.1